MFWRADDFMWNLLFAISNIQNTLFRPFWSAQAPFEEDELELLIAEEEDMLLDITEEELTDDILLEELLSANAGIAAARTVRPTKRERDFFIRKNGGIENLSSVANHTGSVTC
jgi:hypothetical protein